MKPFLIIKGFLEMAKKADNTHCFKHELNSVQGLKKTGAFSMDLDISQIKMLCKKKKCTVNDYVIATLGTTLYEYFENHKD